MSCPDCFKGAIHTHASPKGKFETLHGYHTYVALPENNTPTSPSTIIFYTDAFGLNLVNNKLLADHYAHTTGMRVLVPDIIPGGGASVESMEAINIAMKPVGEWYNWLNPFMYLNKAYNIVYLLGGMVPFALRAGPAKVYPACLKYARDVRGSLDEGGKLGVAGFCWGGYQTTHLCAEPDVEGGSKGLVDAQFNAHPSALKAPDDVVKAIETFKVPYSCAVAEFDFQFDKTLSDQCEAAVRQKLGEGVGTYEFVIHKDCHHGFSVRASFDEGETGKKGYEGAAKQATDWFEKYLK